jgi:hypothetical protein
VPDELAHAFSAVRGRGILRASPFGRSRKLKLLHPAANPALVGQVLLSKGAFQITFLALD